MKLSNYIKRFGTSYYRGNLFFPARIRKAVYTLYAFVRIPDEIVDDPFVEPDQAKSKLESMKEQFFQLYKGDIIDEPYVSFPEASMLFHSYSIPLKRAEDFFDAMMQDTYKNRYNTYKELQEYMYGSAEVVGLMLCKIIGCEEAGYSYAKKLGEAMQYTNFLRDIVEDYELRDRVYIPSDRLSKYGLTQADLIEYITTKKQTKAMNKFICGEVAFCKELYIHANQGIQYLEKKGQLAVKIASNMYEAILDKIIRNNYNITEDNTTTKQDKLGILIRSLYRHATYQKAN